MNDDELKTPDEREGSPVSEFTDMKSAALYILFSVIVIITGACRAPAKPEVNSIVECDIPGTEICPDDTLNCCCIENAYWNTDFSACACVGGYVFTGDTLCVPDTTVHGEITWEYDTLGVGYFLYPSLVRDVEIVDENNIWIVGSFWVDDSTFSPYSPNYNAAHYDGNEWELILINAQGVIGEGIYYFADDDIWVTTGIIYHWNGTMWERYHLWDMGVLGQNDGGVYHIWGSSPDNIYFVGRTGSIVHYDGSSFVQMASGTDVDLKDIAGTPDGEHVFAVGYDETYPARSIILSYESGLWSTLYYCEGVLPSESCQGSINTCTDVIGDNAYFILGFVGLWKYNYLTGESEIIPENEIYFSNRGFQGLDGQNVNDISFVANWGEFIHYNGSTWYLDTTVLDYFGPYNIQTKGMDFKGNVIVSVGYHWAPAGAFVARGYRY